jgi:DNA-binding transcriptional ArsR family regulator
VNAGERVLLVHGLGDPDRVEVVSTLGDGRLVVRYPSGSTVTVPASLVVGSLPSRGGSFRADDPDTAVLAARATVRNLRLAQWAVLDAIVRSGSAGMMDCEHEQVTGSRPDSAGSRRKELERLGLVEDSGKRRQTPRGRHAAVHVATPPGRLAWQHESHRREGAA